MIKDHRELLLAFNEHSVGYLLVGSQELADADAVRRAHKVRDAPQSRNSWKEDVHLRYKLSGRDLTDKLPR